METEVERMVIKEEPLDSDSYGIRCQGFLNDASPDDYTAMSKGYHKESDTTDARSSSYFEGPSSEADDYNVMSRSYSDTGDDGQEMTDQKPNIEELNSEEGDSYQVVAAGDYYDDGRDEACDDDLPEDEGQAQDAPSASTEDDGSVSGVYIKEERVDVGYDFAFTYTTNYVKEEVQSPEAESLSEQNGTCSEQHDKAEENSLDDPSSEETCRDQVPGPRRTRRKRHKAKRLDSFEYEYDNLKKGDMDEAVSLESKNSETGKSGNCPSGEFEVYMDTDHADREQDEEERVEGTGISHDLETGIDETEAEDNNMIAQYAIFDPQKSEMVGIKSVNPKKCDICWKEFQYEFHKKFHMQQVHPESLENDKRKNEQDGPQWKRMQGQNNPRARYSKTCFICMNRIYTHPYYLNLHMQEMHPDWLIDNQMIQSLTVDDETDYSQPDNKNKICPVCFEAFRFAFQLKYHIQNKHAEILVEDKRVDTSKLPSRFESEYPLEDDNTADTVRPSVSASPSGGIKLTYTVKDLLNIKRNLEKEAAAKEVKEAQRLAKSLEPKKRPGRPPKPADERRGKISHINETNILRRGPGRPRKNSDALIPDNLKAKKSLSLPFKHAILDKIDLAGKSIKDLKENISASMEQDTSVGALDFLIKEEPVSDDMESKGESEQHQWQASDLNPDADENCEYPVASEDTPEHVGTQQNQDIAAFDKCDTRIESVKTPDLSVEDKSELLYSNPAANVISFDGGKHLMSSNTRLKFNLNVSESSSSGFAVTDSSQANAEKETEELLTASECNIKDEHVATETKPKRKRKKKDLKDLLPQNVKPIMLPPKKKSKNEAEGLNDPKPNVGKKTRKTNTKTKTPKTPKSSSKQKGIPKTIQVPSLQNKFCGSCGKIFANLQAFNDHEQACTSGSLESPNPTGYYPCQLCSMVFQHVAAHQLHMLRDHIDSSKTCPFCGKIFAYQSVMKKHMYIHTNEAVRKAITALKDDTNAEEDVSIEKDSKLVDLISSLGVQGEVKPETQDNQGSALELSVPFKPVSGPGESLSSLPNVLSPKDNLKAQSAKAQELESSGELILRTAHSTKPENSTLVKSKSETPLGSCQDNPDMKDASHVSAKSPVPYATLIQALSKCPQVEVRSASHPFPAASSSSSSDTASVDASSSSACAPSSLIQTASTSVASSTTGSVVDSSATSIASKLQFPFCPAITSLLRSPTSSTAYSSSTSSDDVVFSLPITPSLVASASTVSSSMAMTSASPVSPLTNASEGVSAPTVTSPLFANSASMISSSIACLKSVIPSMTSSVLSIPSTNSAASPTIPSPSPSVPTTSRQERSTKKTYPCKICNEEFTNIALLYKHELSIHLKHVCPHCNKGFAYEAVLKKHVLIHSTSTSKFSCIWCGKPFSYLKGLKNHLVTHNGTESSHKLNCNKCTKSWYDIDGRLPNAIKDRIGEHLQNCYEDVDDVDDILKTYSSYGAKNKSPKCLQCDKCYKLNSDHSRNVMMAHVYRCKVCNKEFEDISTLKEHVFEHHNEAKGLVSSFKQKRSFNCGSCSEKFTCLFEFMCHMTAHKKAFKAENNG